MRRRLLWHVGFAALVLVTLAGLFEHLTTASLADVRRRAETGAPMAPFSSRPPFPPPRACVDPLELEPSVFVRRPAAIGSSRRPVSPFEQAKILAAAIWHGYRRPELVTWLGPRLPPERANTRIVLNRRTSLRWLGPAPWGSAHWLAAHACDFPGMDLTTLQDFRIQNRTVRLVGPVADLPVPVTFVDVEPGDWRARLALRDRFPDATDLMAASRPGIGRDGREALVYVEFVGEEGWLLLLRSTAGQWRVVRTSRIWIACGEARVRPAEAGLYAVGFFAARSSRRFSSAA